MSHRTANARDCGGCKYWDLKSSEQICKDCLLSNWATPGMSLPECPYLMADVCSAAYCKEYCEDLLDCELCPEGWR